MKKNKSKQRKKIFKTKLHMTPTASIEQNQRKTKVSKYKQQQNKQENKES